MVSASCGDGDRDDRAHRLLVLERHPSGGEPEHERRRAARSRRQDRNSDHPIDPDLVQDRLDQRVRLTDLRGPQRGRLGPGTRGLPAGRLVSKGPAPGEEGSAVILGHVDSYKGEGIFFELKKVKPGDMIDVARADGKTAHFKVTDVRMYLKSQFPDQTVFGARGGATLQIVTCGGDFDQTAKSYLSNVVVYSSLESVT